MYAYTASRDRRYTLKALSIYFIWLIRFRRRYIAVCWNSISVRVSADRAIVHVHTDYKRYLCICVYCTRIPKGLARTYVRISLSLSLSLSLSFSLCLSFNVHLCYIVSLHVLYSLSLSLSLSGHLCLTRVRRFCVHAKRTRVCVDSPSSVSPPPASA